jgi:hypothetical protein
MKKNALGILAFLQVVTLAQGSFASATELSSQIAEFSKTHPMVSSVRLQTSDEGARDFLVTSKGNILGVHAFRLVFWKRNPNGTYASAKPLSSWRAYDGLMIVKVPNAENEYDLYMGNTPDRIVLDEEKGTMTIPRNPDRVKVPGDALAPGVKYDLNKEQKKLKIYTLEGELITEFNNVEFGIPSFDYRNLFVLDGANGLAVLDQQGAVVKRLHVPYEVGDEQFNLNQSPDGKYLAIGTKLGNIIVMAYETGVVVMHGKQLNPNAYISRFSDDGRMLFTVGEGEEINVWNMSRLTVDRILPSLPQQRINAASALLKQFEAEEARLEREGSFLRLDAKKCWDALFAIIYN